MTIYDFVVSFVGEVPEQFVFIYPILTLALSTAILGTFTSIFYFILKLVKGLI